MQDYFIKGLTHFQHPKPHQPQYAPHQWNRLAYGKQLQYVPPSDLSTQLDVKGHCYAQVIDGTWFYYRRAVENTILVALNDFSAQQSATTKNTIKDNGMLMDYLATYPNAHLCFFVDSMQLHVHSKTVYLVKPGARSRHASYFYLVSHPNLINYNKALNNATILTKCKTLKDIVCPTAEAECGRLLHNI
eukprot:6382421-Ditylum_brightwellii.AAC.1